MEIPIIHESIWGYHSKFKYMQKKTERTSRSNEIFHNHGLKAKYFLNEIYN